jgi:DNA-binding response OmpR family regulator
MKILIIDDNAADRNFYRHHIEECNLFANVEIEECGCLSAAFDWFDKEKFDVILLDLGLPESDGIQTIIDTHKELNKKGTMPPIIVLTGLEDKAHTIGTEAFKHGVKDFLTKSEVFENHKELSRSIKYATYSLVR